ncbi:hypothetical protein HHK36_016638 [Tetracentron sinense]|uniref:Protein kinase domain-containing protein n=1 Tax=Tetracentron sinense TaxID=13715 RepID=A0A834Z5M3_TETSI|nr:hypothetical protein HHK36_016638 [Tetracentron sinense]
MCKSKMSADAIEPNSTPRSSRTTKTSEKSRASRTSTVPSEVSRNPKSSVSDPSTGNPVSRNPKSSVSDPSTSNPTSANYTTGSSYRDSSKTSITSRTSLSSLRDSLPENPHIYNFSEICSATNNFLAKRFSDSASAAWRCSIRSKDVIVFQRKFRRSIETSQLRQRLSLICRNHHTSIIKLLGASVAGEHIYLVYDYVNGANLAGCLRNPKNPNFTVLSTWISRMQIAADLAHGLDYIHNCTGLNMGFVHNHIKSTSIIVTEPSFNAKICHFGTAELCGEIAEDEHSKKSSEITEISEDSPRLRRADTGNMKFEGARGYMSPEFLTTGIATQKSDVFAFGVVILELLSGEEPLKYRFDRASGDYMRVSIIETARVAIDGDGDGDGQGGRLRKWVDKRLKDSFPVEVLEKIIRIALECVEVDPDKRPDMGRVTGRISKQYLKSKTWSKKMTVPTDFTVSLAPR